MHALSQQAQFPFLHLFLQGASQAVDALAGQPFFESVIHELQEIPEGIQAAATPAPPTDLLSGPGQFQSPAA
jgi:hypothetical protein